ncbi:hypothetical protein V6X63_10165 [Spiribacter sp. 221]|uniref:hypothetical protein n=1 Tax=Spiribacter onubensis TaxID=3122420 RepID=UPI00349F746D
MDTQAQSRQARRRGLGQRAALAALLAVAVSPAADANTTRVIVDGFYYDIGVELKGNPTTSPTPSERYAPWWSGNANESTDAQTFAEAAFERGISNVQFAFAQNQDNEYEWYKIIDSEPVTGSTAPGSARNYAFVDGAPVAVPEIDAAAIGQGVLALGAIALWASGRRREPRAEAEVIA